MGPRGHGGDSRWCRRFQGALRDSRGVFPGFWDGHRGVLAGLGGPGQEGSHRGFSWQSLKGPEEDLGRPGEGTGSHQNQGDSLRGHRGFPWESQAPAAGTPGVGEEPVGGSQDGPQRSGSPGKGDRRPEGLIARARGSGGGLCSPLPCAMSCLVVFTLPK